MERIECHESYVDEKIKIKSRSPFRIFGKRITNGKSKVTAKITVNWNNYSETEIKNIISDVLTDLINSVSESSRKIKEADKEKLGSVYCAESFSADSSSDKSDG